MNAEGGESLPRSSYLLTVEEIVAHDFLRTIPVTDGNNHPTISARFLQRLNCRTIGHTMDHREPTALSGTPDRAGPEATRAVRSRPHLIACVCTVSEATGVTQVACVPVARPSVRKNRGVKQRCSAT